MPKANRKLLTLSKLMDALIVQFGQLAKFVQSRRSRRESGAKGPNRSLRDGSF
jgi:hypothetical protein